MIGREGCCHIGNRGVIPPMGATHKVDLTHSAPHNSAKVHLVQSQSCFMEVMGEFLHCVLLLRHLVQESLQIYPLPNDTTTKAFKEPGCVLLFAIIPEAKGTCNMDSVRSILCISCS